MASYLLTRGLKVACRMERSGSCTRISVEVYTLEAFSTSKSRWARVLRPCKCMWEAEEE